MKKPNFINSVLTKIIQEVYSSKSLDEGREKMRSLLENCEIKKEDKRKMLYELENIQSLQKLQFYSTNCLLKYEGLGVASKQNVYDK